MRADLPNTESLLAGMEKVRLEIRAAAAAMPDHLSRIRQYCPMDEAA